MFPAAVEYTAPASLDEALDVISDRGEDAKVLAGGQSLIPLLRLRFAAPGILVDTRRLPGLRGIRTEGDSLVIGALTRHADLIDSSAAAAHEPMLTVAARQIADPQVRNLGTIGGSLCHADPEGDWASVLMALHAEVTIASAAGTRTVPMRDFLIGMFTPALEPHELLTSIRIPSVMARVGGDYLKLSRRAGDFAAVGAATSLTLRERGVVRKRMVIETAGIALTAVAPINQPIVEAEKLLVGEEPSEAVLARAADVAAMSVEPHSDARGTAAYKRGVVREYVRRGLERSARLAA